MITGRFASVLRANRDDFNQRFKAARRRFPNLLPEVFEAFLDNLAAPVVHTVERENEHCVPPVAFAVYDAGLVLAGRNLIGPNARQTAVEKGWRHLMPALTPLVAKAPARIFSALSNALYHLAQTPEARPALWLQAMKQIAPGCEEIDTLMALGQVVAWRAGLAHLRHGALAAADGLPPELALAAVGADPAANWPRVRSLLGNNPWYDPGGRRDLHPGRIARRAGEFFGFGGGFAQPPRVAASGQSLYVCSAGEGWLLTADCFGHTFHRIPLDDFESAFGRGTLPQGIAVKGSTVKYRNKPIDLAGMGEVSSVAATRHTLAVTTHHSHQVALVALEAK